MIGTFYEKVLVVRAASGTRCAFESASIVSFSDTLRVSALQPRRNFEDEDALRVYAFQTHFDVALMRRAVIV